MPLKVGKGKFQCLGFCSKTHKRCRLERRQGQKTCQIHTNYYDAWTTKHPPFYHPDHISKRHLKEIIFQLQNHHVEVSQTFLSALAAPYYQYYALVMKYSDYPLSLNHRCFRTMMDEIPTSICHAANRNNFFLFFSRLVELGHCLKDPISCKTTFRFVLYKYICFFSEHNLSFDTGAYILQMTFELPGWRFLLYWNGLDETLDTVWKLLPELPQSFWSKDVFRQHLYMFHMYHANPIRLINGIFKEEAIQKVFHPDRIQRLLDKGYTLDEIFDNA
jgi:hypothetical protein